MKASDIHILLGEDDEYINRAYTAGLRKEGFQVDSVCDGAAVLESLKNGKLPDVIFVDLMMPVKSGFEVIEEISNTDTYKNIPIVVLSNLGQTEDIDKAKSLGATDYLIKSNYSMKEVVAKVYEYVTEAAT